MKSYVGIGTMPVGNSLINTKIDIAEREPSPCHVKYDLSEFIKYDASNSRPIRGEDAICVLRRGVVSLSSSLGAKYESGTKFELLVNKKGSVIILRESDTGIKCRGEGKHTACKLISCKSLTDSLTNEASKVIKFEAKWDEKLSAWVGTRKVDDKNAR